MALDGLLIHNIVSQLEGLIPLRINRIAQIAENELVFECYNQKKVNLIFSIDSQSNRLGITTQPFVRMSEPNHFVMLLRKHLENGYIQSINQIGLDRIIQLQIHNRNDLGDLTNMTLMVELMGKYANVILVDEQQKILDAFNRIAPYENTKRIIFSGAHYELPPIEEKKNPFDYQEKIDLEISLVKQYHGLSPLLAKEIEYRIRNGQDFNTIIESIKSSPNLVISSNNQFHAIELTHLHLESASFPLLEGIEHVYQKQVIAQRIKQHTGNLSKLIKRELKKNVTKKEKLIIQLHEAQHFDDFRNKADLLMTYGHQVKKGEQSVVLNDFENQPITIELDSRYNGIDNAQIYYNKYRKLKKGIQHIQHQLELTQTEIEYYEGLTHQIDQADVSNALEIRAELISKGVIKTKLITKKKKKEESISYQTLEFDGVLYHYGLTNIQNENLTFRVAHKQMSWFHILDGAGSHVVCEEKMENLNERLIRFGANCAAYHSKYRQSSTVGVAYTSVSQLKKIPKAPLGKVQMNEYKTIFIDPIDPLLMNDNLDQTGIGLDKMKSSDS